MCISFTRSGLCQLETTYHLLYCYMGQQQQTVSSLNWALSEVIDQCSRVHHTLSKTKNLELHLDPGIQLSPKGHSYADYCALRCFIRHLRKPICIAAAVC
uniref:Uncharacterized protein n=1 Tax=Manihot esculenta TaxID=3983 RepID=A0A2C9TZU1_MANES